MKLLRPIDNFLNKYTMYRVVLYALLALAAISFLLSFAGILYYSPLQLLVSLLVITISCWISNELFARILKAPTNSESYLITAIILFFILIPSTAFNTITIYIAAGFIAMASKYIFAINRKHIFNPAAFAAFILGIAGDGSALWWVGSDMLLPFVLIFGLMIVRKIRRFKLFFSFLAASTFSIAVFQTINGIPLQQAIIEVYTSWPIIFFGTIMLTEPLTTPSTKQLQMTYGALVGLLFGSQFQFGPFFSTPEMALLVGNIYSYVVGPKVKVFMQFKEKIKAADNTYEFVFAPSQAFHFRPGQYLEWTIPHAKSDTRGNRRYFTIASSPTEKEVRLGVRMEEKGSSFKRKLDVITPKDMVVASQLTGDFTLPENKEKKLVFIAGGIGVTPFRSMIKYLLDHQEKRSIVLFYANKTAQEIAYKDIFDSAQKDIGLQVEYVLTDKDHIPAAWKGRTGRIDEAMLKNAVTDFKDRTFYISGPVTMVDAYKHLLYQLGIPHHQIVTDYFPGF